MLYIKQFSVFTNTYTDYNIPTLDRHVFPKIILFSTLNALTSSCANWLKLFFTFFKSQAFFVPRISKPLALIFRFSILSQLFLIIPCYFSSFLCLISSDRSLRKCLTVLITLKLAPIVVVYYGIMLHTR